MHKLVQFILLSYFFSTHLGFATVDCDDPISGYEGKKGKNYNFKVRMSCAIDNKKLKISELSKRYQSFLQKSSEHSVISTKQKNNKSYLDIVYEQVSEHGKLSLSGPLVLAQEESNTFTYSFNPDKISASGDVKYTKKVVENVKTEFADYLIVTVEKEVTVSKPWFAPEFIFLSEVKKGLEEDLPKVAKFHLRVLK